MEASRYDGKWACLLLRTRDLENSYFETVNRGRLDLGINPAHILFFPDCPSRYKTNRRFLTLPPLSNSPLSTQKTRNLEPKFKMKLAYWDIRGVSSIICSTSLHHYINPRMKWALGCCFFLEGWWGLLRRLSLCRISRCAGDAVVFRFVS